MNGVISAKKIIYRVLPLCLILAVSLAGQGFMPHAAADPGDILFADDFSTDALTGWYNQSATVSGGAMTLGSNGFNAPTASQTWTDYTVEADVKYSPGVTNNAQAGLAARKQGTSSVAPISNGYEFVLLYQTTLGRITARLYHRGQAGASTAQYTTDSFSADTWYHMKMTVRGNSIQCFIDGALVFDITDSTHSAGYAAAITTNVPGTFDNFKVTVPAETVTLAESDFSAYTANTGRWLGAYGTGENGKLKMSASETVSNIAPVRFRPFTGGAGSNVYSWNNAAYSTQAKITIPSAENNEFFGTAGNKGFSGVMARYADASNIVEYRITIESTASADTPKLTLDLFDRKAGGVGTIKSKIILNPQLDRAYTLRLDTYGNHARAYLDGDLVLENTTAVDQGGSSMPGIKVQKDPATTADLTVLWDDFAVTRITAPYTPIILTKPEAAPVWKGAFLSASALNGGTASVPGTFSWADASQTVSATGDFGVTFTPDDGVNYTAVSLPVTVTAIDKSALEDKISEANDILSAAVVGEGNGEYPQAAVDAFSAAIDAAQAVTSAAPTTQQAVTDALDALQDAIEAFEASANVVEFVSVDISWSTLSFTYGGDTWNPATHQYEGGAWTPDAVGANKITVTNESNISVSITCSYTPAEGYGAISGSFTVDEGSPANPKQIILESGDTDPQSKDLFLNLFGAPSAPFTDQTIGSVTVTVALPD